MAIGEKMSATLWMNRWRGQHGRSGCVYRHSRRSEQTSLAHLPSAVPDDNLFNHKTTILSLDAARGAWYNFTQLVTKLSNERPDKGVWP